MALVGGGLLLMALVGTGVLVGSPEKVQGQLGVVGGGGAASAGHAGLLAVRDPALRPAPTPFSHFPPNMVLGRVSHVAAPGDDGVQDGGGPVDGGVLVVASG